VLFMYETEFPCVVVAGHFLIPWHCLVNLERKYDNVDGMVFFTCKTEGKLPPPGPVLLTSYGETCVFEAALKTEKRGDKTCLLIRKKTTLPAAQMSPGVNALTLAGLARAWVWNKPEAKPISGFLACKLWGEDPVNCPYQVMPDSWHRWCCSDDGKRRPLHLAIDDMTESPGGSFWKGLARSQMFESGKNLTDYLQIAKECIDEHPAECLMSDMAFVAGLAMGSRGIEDVMDSTCARPTTLVDSLLIVARHSYKGMVASITPIMIMSCDASILDEDAVAAILHDRDSLAPECFSQTKMTCANAYVVLRVPHDESVKEHRDPPAYVAEEAIS
jgi:hypothetical protein